MSNPYREEFISVYTQNITREGSQKLLAWLDTTDFYTAPGKHKVPLCLRKRPCDAQPECLQGDARALV